MIMKYVIHLLLFFSFGIFSIRKVAIVDFDVHHGNGTEDVVRALHRPDSIFFASLHLYDGLFYSLRVTGTQIFCICPII